MKCKAILIMSAIIILALLVFGFLKIIEPVPLAFQGQVEAREIDVATKVAGRVRKVWVREGDTVFVGDVLFELDSPELNAKLAQANARRDAAAALSNKANSGAREEEIRMAKYSWTRGQSASELAEKTFKRFDTLYEEGLISEQKHDEALSQAKASTDAARAARAQYEMALNGARIEDKAAARAMVGQAEGLIAEVSAYSAETHLTAPITAEVSQVLIDPGELAPSGFPVVTLVDLSDAWVVLNVREDHLSYFKMKTSLTGIVPALDGKAITLSVYFIAPQADFATWRATRYSSGYDIKTFELRLRPSDVIDGLRPGMSVLFSIDPTLR